MKEKVLFLDFDGVLFDTLKEVYLVNRKIFSNIDLFENIDKKNYELYSKYKYLVYNIWMFYYYNPILFSDVDEKNIESSYLRAISVRDISKENEFCENFLAIRKELIEKDYDFWKSLETPYEFFYGIKQIYEKIEPHIVIISKKNKASIIERFESYGFNLPENQVFAREVLDNYTGKGEFIKEYMLNNGFKEAIFVDDNNNNLKTCDNLKNVKQILASWGNHQPELQGYGSKEALVEIENFFN